MPIHFNISERLAGFVENTAQKGEPVSVIFRELLAPEDPLLGIRLENLDRCLFSKIPSLREPSRIGQLVIIINQDLSGIAYVDELPIKVKVKVNRAINKGELVYLKDISEVESVHLGISVPDQAAVVVVNSFLWKRSLFFDFGPLNSDQGPRDYSLEKTLAQQQILLLGLTAAKSSCGKGLMRVNEMRAGLEQLRQLLIGQCTEESLYQELIGHNPWMLGVTYGSLIRHAKMDDKNIPDFTALRAYDQCHDIVELKHPFLKLFRQDGTFTAEFNNSWNQAERYLNFCHRQRAYLSESKGIRFENPRCLLLTGYNLSAFEQREIRAKEEINRLITVISYDQLLAQAQHILNLFLSAGEALAPEAMEVV